MNTCTQFFTCTASQQSLRHGLSLEVDRLRELIGKLENKVPFFSSYLIYVQSNLYIMALRSKSRFFAHTNAIFVTCIRRPPVLSGRGHPVAVLCWSFHTSSDLLHKSYNLALNFV